MSINLSGFAGAGAQFFDDNGDPLVGGLLYVYAAGTTTPVNTYTSQSGITPNTNPIVLDAGGRTPNEIWVNGGVLYKFTLRTSAGVLIGGYPIDNIPAIDDPTTFNNLISVTGTNTLTGTSIPPISGYVAGATYSFIPANTNTGAVTIDIDGIGAKEILYDSSTSLVAGAIQAGKITYIEYDGTRFQMVNSVTTGQIPDGSITPQKLSPDTRIDIASATTIDLTANAPSNRNIRITGSTGPIGTFTVATGQRYFVSFSGTPTITNSASIVTNTGTDIVVTAGDTCIIRSTAANTVEIMDYVRYGDPIQKQVQAISASVGSNALTISSTPLSLDFRSTTLGSGTVTRVTGTPANLVISSGSTLGTVNAVQSDIVVLAINNAGTIELAAVNISGGVDLSETGLISTTAEGGAGGADSASTIYSTTSRSNVAYRVIGVVRSTQTTAGTWATAPSLIQGNGGEAFTSLMSLGYGQTWQNVTGSRSIGTTYYNTTGKPIQVAIVGTNTTGNGSFFITISAAAVATSSGASGAGGVVSLNGIIIPPGASYSISNGSGSTTVSSWYELR